MDFTGATVGVAVCHTDEVGEKRRVGPLILFRGDHSGVLRLDPLTRRCLEPSRRVRLRPGDLGLGPGRSLRPRGQGPSAVVGSSDVPVLPFPKVTLPLGPRNPPGFTGRLGA